VPGRAPAYIQRCGAAASPSPIPGLFPFPACPPGRVPGPQIPQAASHEPLATSHARRATGDEPQAANPGRRFPNPDSRPSAAVCHFGSFLAPRPPSPAVSLPLQMTNDKGPMTVVPRWRVPRPCSPFPVPCSRCCLFASSYAQRRMPIRACKKPSNSIKFESKSIKKATFSVKKASKRRAFRHAHLNILGGHPLWR